MKRIIAIIAILIPGLLSAQEIQEFAVPNFSGGLVNSVSSPLMKPEQAKQLINYDITELGWLHRRQGMEYYKSCGYPAEAVIPYFGDGNELFVVQAQSGSFTDDTAEVAVNVIAKCGSACDTIKYHGLFQHGRYPGRALNSVFKTYLNQTVYASTNSEPVIYNGSLFYPMRPVAPGQSKVVAIDSGGTMTGTYRYKTCFKLSTNDTGNFSPPTWKVTVDNGKVFLWDMPDSSHDQNYVTQLYIYRQSSDTGHYVFLDSVPIDTKEYLDTTSVDPTDTCKYPWGKTDRGYPENQGPGGMLIIVDTCAGLTSDTVGIGIQVEVGHYDTVFVGYATIYEDTAGVLSMMSAPSWAYLTSTPAAFDTTYYHYKATLYSIPVPTDSSIVQKHLIRCINLRSHSTAISWLRETPDQVWSWYKIATLPNDSTIFADSTPVQYTHLADSLYFPCDTVVYNDCWLFRPGGWFSQECDFGTYPSNVYGSNPEDCYGDSTITFQPTDFEIHGARGFAIGNPNNRHRVYYSDFGRFSVWPYDKTLAIPSRYGDWPIALLSLEDRLMVFQQKSIYQIIGLSFSNFSIDEVISGVGLAAPRSLGAGVNEVYFAGSNGFYKFSRFGGIGKEPISLAIKNSVDSIANIAGIWGDMLGDEYWFSVDSSVYIYTENPVPHWRTYSFGLKDGCGFGDDYDYNSREYILLRDNDSLYKWGYSDTCTTDAGVAFTALYQSAPFFSEGEIREYIFYVDLKGSGNVDSLKVTILDKDGTDSILTKTVQVDFTDNKRDRMAVGKLVQDCSVKIEDFGDSDDYTIQGYVIGYKPWDNGRGL